MGVVYRYVNHDLRQIFDCGLGRWNNKWSGVGRNAGARALGILLNRSWSDCRIGLLGDSSEALADYSDITLDVCIMLLESDGIDWLDLDNAQDLQFVGDLAIHLKQANLAARLDAHKKNWRQLHRKLPPNSFTVAVLQAVGRSLIKL